MDTAPDFTISSTIASRIDWAHTSPSTNADLVKRVVADGLHEWPDFSVLLTDNQTAGRGRLDRVWTAPRGSALAISVLLRPGLPVNVLGWIPLLAGLAMTRAVRTLLTDAGRDAANAGIKWPNDVLIGGRKVCGVLSEFVSTDLSVVVGTGINTAMTAEQLPVPTATSLAVECGSVHETDQVLSRYLVELGALYRAFVAASGDAKASGLHEAVTDACLTIGTRVRVVLPADDSILGIARGLDADGRLVVQPDGAGDLITVLAGDITHLR